MLCQHVIFALCNMCKKKRRFLNFATVTCKLWFLLLFKGDFILEANPPNFLSECVCLVLGLSEVVM